MKIVDLDRYHLLSNGEGMVGGDGFVFAAQYGLADDVFGSASAFTSANATGVEAYQLTTGFGEARILSNGYIVTTSGATSISSSGDRP